MLQREAIKAVMKGHSLNGGDRLAIRIGVVQPIQAKECHRRRMTATTYQWTKPVPKR